MITGWFFKKSTSSPFFCNWNFTSHLHTCIHICIYPTPLPQAGYDTRSIFKQCKAGLNSVFLFLDWLLIAYKRWENWWIFVFLKGISMKWKTISLILNLYIDHFLSMADHIGNGDTLSSRCDATIGWAHSHDHVLALVPSCQYSGSHKQISHGQGFNIQGLLQLSWNGIRETHDKSQFHEPLQSSSSNPANPANCLILLAYMSTRSLAHQTMVNFLYAVNALSVNASLSWTLIRLMSVWSSSFISI